MKASLGVQTAARTRRKRPSGTTPSWFTKLDWFLAYEAELLRLRIIPRPFDLDPCGHPEAPVSREILRRGGVVYTEGAVRNGLNQVWARRVVFENPPYNQGDLEAFAVKRLHELAGVDGMVTLLPMWSGQDWFQEHVKPALKARRAEIDFLSGRHKFGWPGNPHGHGGTQAMFPSCCLWWRCGR